MGERRIVVATGGAGGLGVHVVERFLREGASVHVPVRGDEGRARLEGHLGDDLSRVTVHGGVDLARPERVEWLFAEVAEREGRGPDVLLNLAGGFTAAPLGDTEPDTWSRMVAINATTAFLCARAAFPGMLERGWGRIVNVSAIPAIERPGAGLAAYGAAKAAVLQLTRSLAREGAGRGVTANAIVPSVIDTPANRRAMPDADRARWVAPGDIADVILFLASDAARAVTGAAIPLRLD